MASMFLAMMVVAIHWGGVAEVNESSDLSLEAADEEEKPVSFTEVRDAQEEHPEPVGVLGDGGGLDEGHEFLTSNASSIDGAELSEAGFHEGGPGTFEGGLDGQGKALPP